MSARLHVPTAVVRVGVWAWMALVALATSLGAPAALRRPSLLTVEGWSDLYRPVGISDGIVVALVCILPLIFSIAVGALVAWRLPTDRGALVMAAGTVGLYFLVSGLGYVVGGWIGNSTADLAVVLNLAMLVTLPGGRFTPRWTMLVPLVPAAALLADPGAMNAGRAVLHGASTVAYQEESLLFLATAPPGWIVALAVVGIRYRNHVTALERRQMRWLALGLGWMVLPAVALIAEVLVGTADPGIMGLAVLLAAAGNYVMPITLLVAVFRYHLYEIDRIISRTATYAAVAVVVGLVYALPVLVLPATFGGSNQVIVAGSTLLAAAAFNPVRRRSQSWAERRFNRSSYDAAHEIDALATRLRVDASLGSISHSVEEAVERTVQPEVSTLWIRDP